MKTIGILGGMSPESTVEYYRLINQETRRRRGGWASAPLLLYSFDFGRIQELQAQGDWVELGRLLGEAAQSLERAGADCLLIAANTMHLLADEVRQRTNLPLVHIIEATGKAVVAANIKTIGLLGTKFTMEKDFYKGFLTKNFGLQVLVPDEADRHQVHNIIDYELCRGIITAESKSIFLKIIDELADQGCQGIILGCTEIPLLIKAEDSHLPLFDTTTIHVKAAVDLALA